MSFELYPTAIKEAVIAPALAPANRLIWFIIPSSSSACNYKSSRNKAKNVEASFIKFNVHVYVYIPNDRSENEKARRKTYDYIYNIHC